MTSNLIIEQAELYFQNPQQTAHRIAPNGKYVAYLKTWNGYLNLFLLSLDDMSESQLTYCQIRNIEYFVWKSADIMLYLQDDAGNENFHIWAYWISKTTSKNITPYDGVCADIINEFPGDGRDILACMNYENPQFKDAYRIDINSGKYELVAKNPGGSGQYISDDCGDICMSVLDSGYTTTLFKYTGNSSEPVKIRQFRYTDCVEPITNKCSNGCCYLKSSSGRSCQAVIQYNYIDNKEERVLFHNEAVDAELALYSEKLKQIVGVAYWANRLSYEFFNDKYQGIYDNINEVFPDHNINFLSTDHDENLFTIMISGGECPPEFYIYDASSNKLSLLAKSRPWLQAGNLNEVVSISYVSRDGLKINGYLTLPQGKDPRNLPCIIHPHGGPWGRDYWQFNPEVQFLASLGYAVLQMNYRGSFGFGRKLWEAGFKQWGLKMQDDITDGVQWLIDKGIADPERIAIYGCSYGGYTALAGIAFTPDIYACAIDYSGPSNLFTFMESISAQYQPIRKMLYEMIGHPQEDAEQLAKTSPIFHADKIKAPLMVVHGANDPRVKQEEADQIVGTLRQKGIDVQYVLNKNEGHWFRTECHKVDLYCQIAEFLDKHLGN